MKMNRRNALLGLGAIATGGGALFGSGAFSSVEATREATVNVVSDNTGGANVEMTVNDSTAVNNSSGSGNQLGINASNVNEDATTIFEGAFDLKNNDNATRYVDSVDNVTSLNVALTLYKGANTDAGTTVDLTQNSFAIDSGAVAAIGYELSTSEGDAGSTFSGTVDIQVWDEEADAVGASQETITTANNP